MTLLSQTFKRETGCGKIYITICHDNTPENIKKIIINLGKSGGCASAMTYAIAQCITLAIQHKCPTEEIIKNLKGITCHQQTDRSLSCSDAIAKTLENYLDNLNKEKE